MTVLDASHVQRELVLRSAFPDMPVAAHARFVEVMEELEASAGELLFSPGDPPDRLFFLIEGRAAMELEGAEPWIYSPVAVLGIIDSTLERPRKRNCRLLEPSKLLSLRASEWFDVFEDNPQIARGAIKNFALRLHERWRDIVARNGRTSDPPSGPVLGKLGSYEKILALRQAGFVRRAGMQALVGVASVAEPVVLRASEELFSANDDPGHLYVVASGEIELSHGDDFRLRQGPGELIGGPAALAGTLRGYSARALSSAALLEISEQDFYDRAEEHPRLTRGALAYLVQGFELLLETQASDNAARSESAAPPAA